MDKDPAIVIDLGSDTVKIGYSTSTSPEFILPNVVGRPLVPSPNPSQDGVFRCDETTPPSINKTLNLIHPLERATVTHWADQCKVLDYIFHERLKSSPREHNIMIAESSLTNRKIRQKLIEIFFEQYLVPAIHIQPEAFCSICAAGLTSGTVIEIGENVTRIASVIDRQFVPQSCACLNVGAADITDRLVKLIQLREIKFPESQPVDPIRHIKERLCRVSKNIARRRILYEQPTAQFSAFSMTDGRTLQMHSEIYEPAEVLFEPKLAGKKCAGLIPLLFESIANADPTLRKSITDHIVLSGGTALMPGLTERIQFDIKNMINREIKGQNQYRFQSPENILVENFSHSNILVYSGASICAKKYLNSPEYWATRTDYFDDGIDSIVKKFKSVKLRND